MSRCILRRMICAIALLCAGCETTEQGWRSASQRNTPAAYSQFIKDHPDTKEAQEARHRIEELEQKEAWNRAAAQNTIASYESYIAKYPQSTQANEAVTRLQGLSLKRDYAATLNLGSIEGYESFLKQYPASPHTAEMKKRLDELLLNRDWDAAKRTNTVDAYEAFLRQYPASKNGAEARSAIDSLEWNSAQSVGSREALEAFIRKYPKSPNAKKASDRVWDLAAPELVKAAAGNNWGRVKSLVETGADVNASLNGGVTALMYASFQGNMEMVKLLVEKGADINHVAGTESPLYLCDSNFYRDSRKSHPEVVAYLVSSALKHKDHRSPSVKDIREMTWDIVNSEGLNAGSIGIELLTVARNVHDKSKIEVAGNVATWNKSARFELGQWYLTIVAEGDKWKATGKPENEGLLYKKRDKDVK